MSQESTHTGPSRRSFIGTSAAALGAAVLLGRTAGAQPATQTFEPTLPKPPGKDAKKLRIGVIGLGGPGGCAMGLNHCHAFVNLNKKERENVQVAAVCDLNTIFLEDGKKAIEKNQGAGTVDTHTNYRELLARKDIDGVLAAVPEHWHSQVGIDAIKAGKDLYLEKPMCLNLEHSMALYEVAKAHPNVIAQVGTQMTRLPKYQAARKLIKEGAIGVPTFSQTSYCRNSPGGEWHYTIDKRWQPGVNLDWDEWCRPLGSMPWDPKVYYQWRRYRKTSTGIIGDLLVHVMTPLMMALDQGWPVRVAATGAHLNDKEMENHDNINICAQFESGHQMVVAGSTCNQTGFDIMIRGHKANLRLGGRHCELQPEPPYAEKIEPQKIECPDIGDDQDMHRLGWLESIRTRTPAESSVELGLKVMVVVDLATRSMWEGSAFTFDPSTMKASKA